MNANQHEKFRELLRTFDTAVLVTRASDNSLRARPMAIAGVDDSCNLWFITSRDSAKMHEIERHPQVEVVCQNGWNSCVCISGRAKPEEDRARLLTLWNNTFQAWFPQGVNDPEVVLIHVQGERGEYWDGSGKNALTYAYQQLKALATGTIPVIREGEQHGKVKLTAK